MLFYMGALLARIRDARYHFDTLFHFIFISDFIFLSFFFFFLNVIYQRG